MAETSFHQFSRLPIELRGQIWKCFIALDPPRRLILQFRSPNQLSGSHRGAQLCYASRISVPVATKICAESRFASQARWSLGIRIRMDQTHLLVDYESDTIVLKRSLGGQHCSPDCALAAFSVFANKQDLAKVKRLQISWIVLRVSSCLQFLHRTVDAKAVFLMNSFPGVKSLEIGFEGADDADAWRQSLQTQDKGTLAKLEMLCEERGCVIGFMKMEV